MNQESQNHRILLVEDEELLRWSLVKRLEMQKHRVHAVANLAEATEHLGRYLPDLMILDLALPDGHGLDFYQENHERLSDTGVLIITAVVLPTKPAVAMARTLRA